MSGLILGFGSTEQAFVRGEEAAIREQIAERFGKAGLSYFTAELKTNVSNWLTARAASLHAKAAGYKGSADFPDRYSYYWPTVLDDANHIVVILKTHHINRRHAMSPDGWALMKEQAVFLFEALDFYDAVQAQSDAA